MPVLLCISSRSFFIVILILLLLNAVQREEVVEKRCGFNIIGSPALGLLDYIVYTSLLHNTISSYRLHLMTVGIAIVSLVVHDASSFDPPE